jgi:hypothetical protein
MQINQHAKARNVFPFFEPDQIVIYHFTMIPIQDVLLHGLPFPSTSHSQLTSAAPSWSAIGLWFQRRGQTQSLSKRASKTGDGGIIMWPNVTLLLSQYLMNSYTLMVNGNKWQLVIVHGCIGSYVLQDDSS